METYSSHSAFGIVGFLQQLDSSTAQLLLGPSRRNTPHLFQFVRVSVSLGPKLVRKPGLTKSGNVLIVFASRHSIAF